MSVRADDRFWVGGATQWDGPPAPGLQLLAVSSDPSQPATLQMVTPLGQNPMFGAFTHGGSLVISHEVADGSLSLILDPKAPTDGVKTDVTQAPTGSGDPTNVAVLRFDSGTEVALSANYGGGALSMNPIEGSTIQEPTLIVKYPGSGPVIERQASSHPHQVVIDRRSGSVLVPDLGTDSVHIHKIEDLEQGLPDYRDLELPKGSGPRHLVVSGDCAIVACELDAIVHVLSIENGSAITSATPAPRGSDSVPNFPSAIRLTRQGHVLVGNRGPDSIGVLAWDRDAESLEYLWEFDCGGSHPRDFQLNEAEDRIVVANLDSNSLAVFSFDDAKGIASLLEVIATNSPTCAIREIS